MHWRVVLVLLGLGAAPSLADEVRPMLPVEAATPYHAVGRLNIAGERYCTATLIAPDLVLTAAHCLHHPVSGKLVDRAGLRFVAGYHRGDYAALREVVAISVLPDFDPEIASQAVSIPNDLGLVRLKTPIPKAQVAPIGTGAVAADEPLTIVSYARDRPYAPSIQTPCRGPLHETGVLVSRCPVNYGASGAPVMRVVDGHPQLVAVVSAMGRDEFGLPISLSAPIAGHLATLEAGLRTGDE